jgi:hypothetical protein
MSNPSVRMTGSATLAQVHPWPPKALRPNLGSLIYRTSLSATNERPTGQLCPFTSTSPLRYMVTSQMAVLTPLHTFHVILAAFFLSRVPYASLSSEAQITGLPSVGGRSGNRLGESVRTPLVNRSPQRRPIFTFIHSGGFFLQGHAYAQRHTSCRTSRSGKVYPFPTPPHRLRAAIEQKKFNTVASRPTALAIYLDTGALMTAQSRGTD